MSFATNAQIPPRFRDLTRASYPLASDATAAVVERLAWWVCDPDIDDLPEYGERKESLYLYGPCGVGKTGLAVALLKEMMDMEGAGLFVTLRDLLEETRRSFGASADNSQPSLLDRATTVPVLLLDDLGAEKPSAWVADILYGLVNHRHGQDAITIFTSNLGLGALAAHIDGGLPAQPAGAEATAGQRIAWRVAEMANVVRLDGPNLRAAAQDKASGRPD